LPAIIVRDWNVVEGGARVVLVAHY
jgi:hypothetical protein